MADLKQWMLSKEQMEVTEQFKASDNLPEFTLRALTAKEIEDLQKTSTKKHRAKNGSLVSDVDTDKLTDGMFAKAVVAPDLNDADLQEYYGTIGDAAGTLRAMLLAGEYTRLQNKINKMSGFDTDENEEVEEVKN